MSRFAAECPVNGCDFKKESHWKNTAVGGVFLHLYRTEGKGHGPKGSRPEGNFDIQVERMGKE